MKKLIILSAVVTLALLTISCKKDEKINLLTTDISPDFVTKKTSL